jgi:hypothetical protein
MQSPNPQLQLPRFALTIPRPWVWLIAQGVRRDWLVATDPSRLVGQAVALHSAGAGDAEGWRRFDAWASSSTSRQEVLERCPHSALVGIASVVGVDALGLSWRVRLAPTRTLAPLGPIASGDLELWPLPLRWRDQLHQVVSPRPSAAAIEGVRS